MLTRCPNCTTTFRVKPEQLKARLGRVRCGECKTVFNALDSLVEELPPTPVVPEAPAAPQTFESLEAVSTLPPSVSEIETAPSLEAEPTAGFQDAIAEPAAEIEPPTLVTTAEAEVAVPAMETVVEPVPELQAANDPIAAPEAMAPEVMPSESVTPMDADTASEPVAEVEEVVAAPAPSTTAPDAEQAAWEDTVLLPSPDTWPVPEEPVAGSAVEPLPEAAPAASEPKAEDLDFTLTEVIEAPVVALASETPADAAPVAAPAEVPTETPVATEPSHHEAEAASLLTAADALSPAVAEEEPLLHQPRPARRWPWVTLAVLSSLLLAGQALIQYRVEVAVAAPALKPLLKAVCEPLGCEVPRPRKSELLDIESSDLHPGKQKGRLELVAVLKNKAPYSQEWPVLEVSLTDVADQPLIVKALQPADYLPAGRKPTAGFPAKAEINVNLTLDAGDTPASGYRLYLYYP